MPHKESQTKAKSTCCVNNETGKCNLTSRDAKLTSGGLGMGWGARKTTGGSGENVELMATLTDCMGVWGERQVTL